ncbi:MAG: E3 binding domain-containing protein [Armatimonadota bacterium]
MAQPLVLEPLYPEMEEATIGQWLVGEGESIEAGQTLAELITDKVAYEYQSPIAGTLLAILSTAKSVVPVGTTLAVVGAAGESVENIDALMAENRRLTAERESTLTALQQATSVQTPAAATAAGGAVRATPAARRLARERGVDLSSIRGTGPNGMISVEDVMAQE